MKEVEALRHAAKTHAKEISLLQEQGRGAECCVCYENYAHMATVACGHLCLCLECARTLPPSAQYECLVCRTPNTGMLQIYGLPPSCENPPPEKAAAEDGEPTTLGQDSMPERSRRRRVTRSAGTRDNPHELEDEPGPGTEVLPPTGAAQSSPAAIDDARDVYRTTRLERFYTADAYLRSGLEPRASACTRASTALLIFDSSYSRRAAAAGQFSPTTRAEV